MILSPVYWVLAHRYDVPGLRYRLDCARLGLRLLWNRKVPISYGDLYSLFVWPLNSTRYFEFAFMGDGMAKRLTARYLDVSSPRLFPIILLLKKPEVFAELLNPDAPDLTGTGRYVEALHLEKRCSLRACVLSGARLAPGSFDVVTSMSVVEHIPQDSETVQQMWNLLKPGGRLLLTLPCAAQASEQYANRDSYGLLAPDEEGYFFFQRLYDQRLLEERIFRITGEPIRHLIYGEKYRDTLRKNLDQKRGDPRYPYWREPYMMGQNFRYFNELAELPGEGVIALEFEKRSE